MTFRVGFDLDGVLADLAGALGAAPPAPAAGRATPSLDPAWTEPAFSEADWARACATTDFWETLPEIEPGGVRRLAALADAQAWEVVFLTQRPRTAGATTQRQTQRWLVRHGFAFPSVCVVTRSRGRVADALSLDCIVDDRWDACLDVLAESRARPILLWRQDRCRIASQAQSIQLAVATSLTECLTMVQEVARSRSSRTTLRKVRRWIGRWGAAIRETRPG